MFIATVIENEKVVLILLSYQANSLISHCANTKFVLTSILEDVNFFALWKNQPKSFEMEINCRFALIDWENNSILYTCEVTVASITEPHTDIANFKGRHILGKSNIDVKAISFKHTQVKYFPRRISDFFPNLIALQIENCGLTSISRRDLNGLQNLNDVSIFDNDLVELPNDLFKNFDKLTMIYWMEISWSFLALSC